MMSPDVSSVSWDIQHDTFTRVAVALVSGAGVHEEAGRRGPGGETLQMASSVTSATCVTASDDPLPPQL